MLTEIGKLSKVLDEDLGNLERHQELSSLIEAHMMLNGFALENLVKAVSIKKYELAGNRSITTFQELSSNVWGTANGHDILRIAGNCQFDLNDTEQNFVERCSAFHVWAGRYHIPKNKRQYDDVQDRELKTLKMYDEFTMNDIFKKAELILGPAQY